MFIFWLFEDFPNILQYIRSAEVSMCMRSIYKLFRKCLFLAFIYI